MLLPLFDRRSACWLLPSTIGVKLWPERTDTVSTTELAVFLATRVPTEFLRAVQASGGKFLYRGDEPGRECFSWDRAIRICSPPPDLLQLETYGDAKALAYFQALEDRLAFRQKTFVAKPSNGHIATSDPLEAGRWGTVVSIWPLLDANLMAAERFSYLWPAGRRTLYNGEEEPDSNIPTPTAGNRITNNALVINEGLADALAANDGREILFATDTTDGSSFLTVPIELDGALRRELETIGYGLVGRASTPID